MDESPSEDVGGDVRSSLARLSEDPDERIRELQQSIPETSHIEHQHRVFRALANENRLKLLEALRDGEKCVCELRVTLDAPQSTVASHLGTLREADIVKKRKDGRWNYYRIADTGVLDVLDLAASI